jgi:excisionase family DNA binding protein
VVVKELLTVPEVAELKGVTRTAVLYAIYDRRLKAVQVGRNWVVRRSDLETYVPRGYRRKPTSSRRVPR